MVKNGVLLGLLLGVILTFCLLAVALPPSIPHCYEDEAIVGFGQFDDGYYELYRCIPLDDLGGQHAHT